MELSWSTGLGTSALQTQGSVSQLSWLGSVLESGTAVIVFGLCSDGVKLCSGKNVCRQPERSGRTWHLLARPASHGVKGFKLVSKPSLYPLRVSSECLFPCL